MSDPVEQGTMSTERDFRVAQEYGPRTASIQPLDVENVTKKEDVSKVEPNQLSDELQTNLPRVAKVEIKNFTEGVYGSTTQGIPQVEGVGAGTFKPFVPSASSPLPRAQPAPRKVGGEIKNPETERLLSLAKVAAEAGIEVEKEGDQHKLILPDDLVDQLTAEHRLKAQESELKAMSQEEQANILRSLLPLVSSVATLEVKLEHTTLSQPERKQDVDNRIAELKKLLEEATNEASAEKRDELKKKIEEANNYLNLIRSTAPTSAPAATVAPTTAPVTTSSPAPTATTAPIPEVTPMAEWELSYLKSVGIPNRFNVGDTFHMLGDENSGPGNWKVVEVLKKEVGEGDQTRTKEVGLVIEQIDGGGQGRRERIGFAELKNVISSENKERVLLRNRIATNEKKVLRPGASPEPVQPPVEASAPAPAQEPEEPRSTWSPFTVASEEETAPQTPEDAGVIEPPEEWAAQERAKDLEQEKKLRKVTEVLKAKVAGIGKIAAAKNISPWWLLMGAVATSTIIAVAVSKDKAEKIETPPAAEARQNDYTKWQTYMKEKLEDKEYADMVNDILTLSPSQLVEKRIGDTKALAIDGYRILREVNDSVPELTDEQRVKASKILSVTEKLAESIIAAADERVKQGHAQYPFMKLNPPDALNHQITRGITMEKYLNMTRNAEAQLKSS